jgi:hypothetical protein
MNHDQYESLSDRDKIFANLLLQITELLEHLVTETCPNHDAD